MSSNRSSTRPPNDRRGGSETESASSSNAAGGRERRAARRVHLRAPLIVRWPGEPESSKLRILDLSRSGFRFECHKIYSIHDHGHAESIKPEGTHIGSDFVIVWAREVKAGTFQYGARFVKSESLRRSA
jgi:hypothetical protein